MGLYTLLSLNYINAECRGMVGDLGVWTTREAHQLGARDDLSSPLPFGQNYNNHWIAN
jgi:hypothetical protein